jgi:hypothetical protein
MLAWDQSNPKKALNWRPFLNSRALPTVATKDCGRERAYAWHLDQASTTFVVLERPSYLYFTTRDSLFDGSQPFAHFG